MNEIISINGADPGLRRPFRLSDLQNVYNELDTLIALDSINTPDVSETLVVTIAGFKTYYDNDGTLRVTNGVLAVDGKLYFYTQSDFAIDENEIPLYVKTTPSGDVRIFSDRLEHDFSFSNIITNVGSEDAKFIGDFSIYTFDQLRPSFLKDGSVTTPKIGGSAVTEQKIADSSVTNAKMKWVRDNVSLGVNTRSNGNVSIAIGNNCISSGVGDVALGRSANTYSANSVGGNVAIGNNTRVGILATNTDNNVAIGNGASCLGSGSTAIGNGATTNSDNNSIKLGNSSIVSFKCQVALTVTSDSRDKIDVKDTDKKLSKDIILSLRTKSYNANPRSRYVFKNEEGEDVSVYDEAGNIVNYDVDAHKKGMKKGERTRVGFIAQDVQQLITDLTGNDKYGSLVTDNRIGNDKITDDGSQLGLTYEHLVPLMVDTIQEQQKQLNEQNARLDAMQKQLDLLLSK